SFQRLVEWQIAEGTHGLVPVGTTGESPTLSHDEHKEVVELCIKFAKKRVPVIAGAGSNSTNEAIDFTRHAKKAGADAVLHSTGYYNKPTQEGLVRHYTAIADAVAIPQILYNVPGRTGVNMLPETVARLAPHTNIVAIKEATGSLQQASEILALCGDQIDVLSGDDFITFPMMACGAKGVISVLANIMPKAVADLTDAFYAGDLEKARQLHLHTLKIGNAMFIESNPIPVKTALGLMGKCPDEVRLPLCEMSEGNKAKLATIMKEYKLI
ncbi:4-hydroxy-tetrahydrodipicolinate synthase, partial [Geobacter sp.]|uniref:4-hydroxy-tetrahydrodipicolinate synthase n=1 Tax=Geobacter sp. TaxID=46610 RepID=UPI0027BA49F0